MRRSGMAVRGVAGIVAAVPGWACAQIATDGTLGAPTVLSGPNFAIPAALGRQAGTNLFHSFAAFGVPTGGSATFSGPAGIGNVISRVTGGAGSSIDGRIASSIAGANVFLINPRGIVFGPNASLDVSGAFHASTASYLRFADGTRFAATADAPAVLSTAAPEAFGFLAPTGTVAVQGANWDLAAGRGVTLVGGDVTITNALLRTRAAELLVAAVASGEIAANGAFAAAPGASMASVGLSGAQLFANSSGSLAPGRLVIRGGQIAIAGTTVRSTNASAAAAPAIEIAATGGVEVSDASRIYASTQANGRGADIVMRGGDVTVASNSRVWAFAQAAGRAGDVDVAATDSVRIVSTPADPDFTLVRNSTSDAGATGDTRIAGDRVLIDGGTLQSYTLSSGDVGRITLTGREVEVVNFGSLYNSAQPRATGRGGDIEVTAAQRIRVASLDWNGDPTIQTDTSGPGHAGNIRVSAPAVSVDAGALASFTFGAGNGGTIAVRGAVLEVLNGAYLFTYSSPESSGSAGSLSLRATDRILATGLNGNSEPVFLVSYSYGSGHAGDVTLSAPEATVRGGRIFSTTYGAGDAGSIRVSGDVVRFLGGNGTFLQVESNASNFTSGNGGDIEVRATRRFELDGTGFADPDTESWTRVAVTTQGSGRGGQILVDAPEILIDRATLFSRTRFGTGQQGGITLRGGDLLMRNQGSLASSAEGTKQGSFVLVDVKTLTMEDTAALVSVANEVSTGGAGPVTVLADRVAMKGSSYISTDAAGTGPAGDILIDARERFEMSSRQRFPFRNIGTGGGTFAVGEDMWPGGLLSRAVGPGNAGSITIRSPDVLLDSGRIQATVAGSGLGGRVDIDAGGLVLRNGSQIDAKSLAGSTGTAGQITLTARRMLEISGTSPVDGLASGVNTETAGSGNAGAARLTADEFVLDRGFVRSTTGGQGNAGTIDVRARTFDMRNGARLDASTSAGSSGESGSVVVQAAERATLSCDGTVISTATAGSGTGGRIALTGATLAIRSGALVSATTTGSGRGGDVTLAAEDLTVTGGGAVSATSAAAGAAGRIDIRADRLSLVDGGLIDARTLARDSGAAGSVTIVARRGVNIDGAASGVNDETAGDGAGGGIRIDAPNLVLNGGFVQSSTSGRGRAGDVEINAGDVWLASGARLDASARAGSSGGGGDVHVRASGAIVASGAGTSVSTSTAGSGPGGEITLAASTIAIGDGASVSASSTGAGDGGAITLAAQRVDITSGATVAATSSGSGAAGRIDVRAVDALYLYGGAISTDAAAADGGNIDVRAGRMIHLRGGEISTSVAGGGGAGGNIFIDPTFVILEDGSRVFANAFGGPGGNITLIADYFFASIESLVQASSTRGVPGTITIATPQNNVNAALAKLPATVLDASAFLRDNCTPRAAGMAAGSSLVDIGRGGLAASPERLAASRYFGIAGLRAAGPDPSAGASAADSGPRLSSAARASSGGCAG